MIDQAHSGLGRSTHKVVANHESVDRGIRGDAAQKTQVLISGSKRGLTPDLTQLLGRCEMSSQSNPTSDA